ncbi:hypothetical protein C2G38_2203229 [Gigaspora rosea]|uniref:Uncharacterized protein n=1 Tax=Gigaspora rosea TaxID=44941 RepID=A0A397UMZ1_9GLOM|nr:hypothetical protein C2G38_2203229 [Gigaspora rosea]
MDLYYIRWKLGSKDDIKILNFESLTFKHQSSTNSDKWCLVDMQVGILNQPPVLSVNSRYHYAYLALGEKRKDLNFYMDLHQEKINQEELLNSAEFATLNKNNSVENAINKGCKNKFPNFDDKENILPESSACVSVQSLINEDISDAESAYDNYSSDEESRSNDSIDGNTKVLLEKNDSTFDKSIRKFVNAYKKCRLVQDTHIYSAIASFLQTCDWNTKRVNGKSYQRSGKRIRDQVTSSARRKKSSKKQKKLEQENQAQDTDEYKSKEPTRYIMPARSKRLQKKRSHNLNKALIESRPNGT